MYVYVFNGKYTHIHSLSTNQIEFVFIVYILLFDALCPLHMLAYTNQAISVVCLLSLFTQIQIIIIIIIIIVIVVVAVVMTLQQHSTKQNLYWPKYATYYTIIALLNIKIVWGMLNYIL